MGLISERSDWVDNIYLIELTDPVLGGEQGINNIQAKQLANRTRFIKDLFEMHHQEDGTHLLKNSDFSDFAGIAEEKLALVHGTEEIKNAVDLIVKNTNTINNRIDDAVGIKGSMVSALGKAVPLTWSYSERGFEFDMFAAIFNYRDTNDVNIIQAIRGDDSVDVSDSSKLKVGNTYVIHDGFGKNVEVFVLKEVLTDKRILVDRPVAISRVSGKLTQTSWNIDIGSATAVDGAVYITKKIKILENYNNGKFVVRLKSNGANVTPYWQKDGESTWTKGAFIESLQRVPGYSDISYEIAGGVIRLKLVASVPIGSTARAEVDHMCVLPVDNILLTEAVKLPRCVTPENRATNVADTKLVASPYRSLYGITQKAAQFQISTGPGFNNLLLNATKAANFTTVDIPEGTLQPNSAYYWRVRYQDLEDVWSRWSKSALFYTGNQIGLVESPHNTNPPNKALGVTSGVQLVAGEFQAMPADTHIKSQWAIYSDELCSQIVIDSGETNNLTSYTLPAGVLLDERPYYWRVRYRGALLGWSDWSSATEFTTASKVNSGNVEFLVGGSYNWTVPDGLTQVSVALVPGETSSSFSDSLYAYAGTTEVLSGTTAIIPAGVKSLTLTGKGGVGTVNNAPINFSQTYTSSGSIHIPSGIDNIVLIGFGSSGKDAVPEKFNKMAITRYISGEGVQEADIISSMYTGNFEAEIVGSYTSGDITGIRYAINGATYASLKELTYNTDLTDQFVSKGIAFNYVGSPLNANIPENNWSSVHGTIVKTKYAEGCDLFTITTTLHMPTETINCVGKFKVHYTPMSPATTGLPTTVTYDGRSYSFNGSLGSVAPNSTTHLIPDNDNKMMEYVVPTGGSLVISYYGTATSTSTGRDTTATINGETYVFPGGLGGAALEKSHQISLPGDTASTLVFSIAAGGVLKTTRGSYATGADGLMTGASFSLSPSVTIGGSLKGGLVAWRNDIPVTPGISLPVVVGSTGGVRIIWGPDKSFPNKAS